MNKMPIFIDFFTFMSILPSICTMVVDITGEHALIMILKLCLQKQICVTVESKCHAN